MLKQINLYCGIINCLYIFIYIYAFYYYWDCYCDTYVHKMTIYVSHKKLFRFPTHYSTGHHTLARILFQEPYTRTEKHLKCNILFKGKFIHYLFHQFQHGIDIHNYIFLSTTNALWKVICQVCSNQNHTGRHNQIVNINLFQGIYKKYCLLL